MQTAHVKQSFVTAEVKHKASLKQLIQAHAQQEASDVQWQHLQGSHEVQCSALLHPVCGLHESHYRAIQDCTSLLLKTVCQP